MSVFCMHAEPTEVKKGNQILQNWNELSCECWEWNLGSLEEQPVLLSTVV